LSLISAPDPHPPLFPSTTLFRSRPGRRGDRSGPRPVPAALDEVRSPGVRRPAMARRAMGPRGALRLRALSGREARRDHGGDQSLGHGTRDADHGIRPARAVARVSGGIDVVVSRRRALAIGLVIAQFAGLTAAPAI